MINRLPRVRLELPYAVWCWAVRAVAAAVAVGTGAVVVESSFSWFLLLVVAGLIMALPGGWAGPLLLLVLTPVLALRDTPVPAGELAALIAGTHLTLVLCAVIGVTAWAAKVELACLVPPLRRYAAVQVVAQTIALAGGVAAGLPPGLPWLAPAVALALMVGVHWLLPRIAPELDQGYTARQRTHDFAGESVLGPGAHRDDSG